MNEISGFRTSETQNQPDRRNPARGPVGELAPLDPAMGANLKSLGLGEDAVNPSDEEDNSDETLSDEQLFGSEEMEMSDEAERIVAESDEDEPLIAEDPDAVVFRDFLAGNDKAFIQIYAKYEAPLLLYCRRMMSSERMGEDAFQEIWVRIFELRNRSAMAMRGDIKYFRAFLFRSARNLCLNTIRLERHRQGSSEPLEFAASLTETQQTSEQRELKELLRRALNKLPFEQREVFVLHEYSGYSYLEIAQMMGSNEQNIKTRAFRARLRLRKLITSWLGLREDDDPSSMI